MSHITSRVLHTTRWRLHSLRLAWQSLTAVVRAEAHHHRAELPWKHKLRAYRHGFTTDSYVLYNLREKDTSVLGLYVSDLKRVIRPGRVDGWFKHLLQDKLAFAASMAFIGFDNVPVIYGTLFRGKVYSRQSDLNELPDLMALLETTGQLVLKPIRGEGGGGVFVARAAEEGFALNGRLIAQNDLARFLGGLNSYLIQEAVDQADYSSHIFPSSVNTIRLVTMRDPQADRPFLAAAIHRFGTRESMPVDNVDRGGLSAYIDMESGCLGRASGYLKKGFDAGWCEIHPDTGTTIARTQIPKWQEIKAQIIAIADGFPQLPIVGWDAVLDSNQRLRILEGNVKPALRILQMHEPLLTNPRVRAFYKLHKVL